MMVNSGLYRVMWVALITIIYYEELIQQTTIMESQHGYNLTYKCSSPTTMTIPHNYSFNNLFNNNIFFKVLLYVN